MDSKALNGNVSRGTGDADKSDRREMQVAALRYDLSTAKPLRELVLGEIRLGADPRWIAMKYGHFGVTLERVLAAKAAIERQEEAKRDRAAAAAGGV